MFGVHQSFLWGNLCPCIGLLVTSPLGFKARVDTFACMLCCLCAMESSDSHLVWHLLTSWQPAWQPSHPPILANNHWGWGGGLSPRSASTDWAMPARKQRFSCEHSDSDLCNEFTASVAPCEHSLRRQCNLMLMSITVVFAVDIVWTRHKRNAVAFLSVSLYSTSPYSTFLRLFNMPHYITSGWRDCTIPVM